MISIETICDTSRSLSSFFCRCDKNTLASVRVYSRGALVAILRRCMQSRRSVNRCSGTRLLILSLQPLMHWTRECCRECVCCGRD
ncbi:hypothetical protein HanPSC8_Chr06g0258291 [Helianthus annuus]|nr:hypothetical protein HanPSC8_Chr06g0258291 [Helianthus annuus]